MRQNPKHITKLLHDKLEKISDTIKASIVYEQMGEIGEMISATIEISRY